MAGALPARALAAPDARELQAREDFAAGRYQVALEVFARLYAETLHPNYLRNIGRCYQNLGEPERAITSFRDYLHKGKNISADERAEIDGYIKDMQDLERQRETGAAPAKRADGSAERRRRDAAARRPSLPRDSRHHRRDRRRPPSRSPRRRRRRRATNRRPSTSAGGSGPPSSASWARASASPPRRARSSTSTNRLARATSCVEPTWSMRRLALAVAMSLVVPLLACSENGRSLVLVET